MRKSGWESVTVAKYARKIDDKGSIPEIYGSQKKAVICCVRAAQGALFTLTHVKRLQLKREIEKG